MIRSATLDDVPALLEMGARFHAMSPWSGFPLDRDRLEENLRGFIASDHAAILVLDNLRGAVGVFVAQAYFAAATVAQEMFWYCEAPSQGLALLDAAEAWAKDKGADIMTMIRLEGVENERMDKIYRRRGYAPTEHNYMRAL